MPTGGTASYQLPDLLSLVKPFELRTNRYCRVVTVASESWILDNGLGLHEKERVALRGIKAGLLAALCYPTADAPQLRLATDFLTSLIYSGSRVLCSSLGSSDWACELVGGARREGEPCVLVADHTLFRHLSRDILRLADRVHPSWLGRFNSSTQAFRAAHVQVAKNRRHDHVPALVSYLELRRNLSGLRMLFDLIELIEGLNLPNEVANHPLLKNLVNLAIDVISWSTDIASYNLHQSLGNNHNLVAILMAEDDLTVQGAVHLAANYVKQAVENFLALERHLSNRPVDLCFPAFGQLSSSGWENGVPNGRDMDIYVQGLRDFIAGSVNWLYETQLFFGDRGEQVRMFGWVFTEERAR